MFEMAMLDVIKNCINIDELEPHAIGDSGPHNGP